MSACRILISEYRMTLVVIRTPVMPKPSAFCCREVGTGRASEHYTGMLIEQLILKQFNAVC